MEQDLKDKNPNYGIIFFLILFLVFAMVYSDGSDSMSFKSAGYSFQNELTPGNGSLHFDATITEAVNINDLYRNGAGILKYTGFNLFSLKYNITTYSQRVTLNLADIQKTNLEIKPLFIRRLLYHLSSVEKEDLPFLS